jgi:hypothetical protein
MATKPLTLDERLSAAQLELRDGYNDHLSAAVADARNIINERMAWHTQRLTDSQADAIVGAMFRMYVDGRPDIVSKANVSLIAAIVCDATSADITCQPLHEAYRRAKERRQA